MTHTETTMAPKTESQPQIAGNPCKELPMKFRTLSSELFGPWKRFKLDHVLDRFGTERFMVADANVVDTVTGLPDLVVDEATRDEAIAKAMARVERGQWDYLYFEKV